MFERRQTWLGAALLGLVIAYCTLILFGPLLALAR